MRGLIKLNYTNQADILANIVMKSMSIGGLAPARPPCLRPWIYKWSEITLNPNRVKKLALVGIGHREIVTTYKILSSPKYVGFPHNML